MIPLDPEPLTGENMETFEEEEECAEDDWDCKKSMWITFVTDSLRRIGTADFSNFNGDFMVSLAFMALCVILWQVVQFVFQKCVGGKGGYKRCPSTLTCRNRVGDNSSGIGETAVQNERVASATETEDHREADVRAAGDSWEQDEYDPDYDANHEIMVMLLQDTPDDSDEAVTPLRSDVEDEVTLQELIRPEDEVQLVEIQNETNDTGDLPTASHEENPVNSNGITEEKKDETSNIGQ